MAKIKLDSPVTGHSNKPKDRKEHTADLRDKGLLDLWGNLAAGGGHSLDSFRDLGPPSAKVQAMLDAKA